MPRKISKHLKNEVALKQTAIFYDLVARLQTRLRVTQPTKCCKLCSFVLDFKSRNGFAVIPDKC